MHARRGRVFYRAEIEAALETYSKGSWRAYVPFVANAADDIIKLKKFYDTLPAHCHELDEKQIFQLINILLEEKTAKESRSQKIILSLKGIFEKNGATLELYRELKKEKLFNEKTASSLYKCEDLRLAEAFVNSIKQLHKNNLKPSDDAVYRLRHHLYLNVEVNRLSQAGILSDIAFKGILTCSEEDSCRELVDCALKVKNDKEMSDTIFSCPKEAEIIGVLYSRFQEEKLIFPESKSLIHRSIRQAYASDPQYGIYRYFKMIPDLKKLGLLDAKNMVAFSRILSVNFKAGECILSLLKANDIKEVAGNRKKLDFLCDLFVKNSEKAIDVGEIIENYPGFDIDIPLTLDDVKNLFEQKPEEIRRANRILKMLNRFRIKHLEFSRPRLFEKILDKKEGEAIEKSMLLLENYLILSSQHMPVDLVGFIFKYSEYMQQENFKKVFWFLSDYGVLTAEALYWIFDSPNVGETLLAILKFKNDYGSDYRLMSSTDYKKNDLGYTNWMGSIDSKQKHVSNIFPEALSEMRSVLQSRDAAKEGFYIKQGVRHVLKQKKKTIFNFLYAEKNPIEVMYEKIERAVSDEQWRRYAEYLKYGIGKEGSPQYESRLAIFKIFVALADKEKEMEKSSLKEKVEAKVKIIQSVSNFFSIEAGGRISFDIAELNKAIALMPADAPKQAEVAKQSEALKRLKKKEDDYVEALKSGRIASMFSPKSDITVIQPYLKAIDEFKATLSEKKIENPEGIEAKLDKALNDCSQLMKLLRDPFDTLEKNVDGVLKMLQDYAGNHMKIGKQDDTKERCEEYIKQLTEIVKNPMVEAGKKLDDQKKATP